MSLSNCSDKVWLIKPKRGADGKRNDRKIFRSGIKTRYDTLPTKMGVSSTDSTSAGNNLLGMRRKWSFLTHTSFTAVLLSMYVVVVYSFPLPGDLK